VSLRIGTSGWSYPSGKGTWNGLFYPPRKGRASSVPGFDELTWYAEHFDVVEVNSSFYGPPTPDTTRKWAARTPAGFEFCLKLHQKFTHPEMYKKAALSDLPDQSADVLAALARVTAADVGRFKDGLEPLAVQGRLGALLARHRAAWAQIDEPKFRFSIRQNGLPNQEGVAYMRLHGRNAAQWWRHDATEDRYNYLYSADELRPIAETAVATAAIVKKAYLFLNNHFSSKAVVNAVVLKHLTGEPIIGTYPPEMVERFPELEGLVAVAPFTASRTFFG
jgi:uncharacterized protein YecE (DUF72 family)